MNLNDRFDGRRKTEWTTSKRGEELRSLQKVLITDLSMSTDGTHHGTSRNIAQGRELPRDARVLFKF